MTATLVAVYLVDRAGVPTKFGDVNNFRDPDTGIPETISIPATGGQLDSRLVAAVAAFAAQPSSGWLTLVEGTPPTVQAGSMSAPHDFDQE